jgi:hypothetical protein
MLDQHGPGFLEGARRGHPEGRRTEVGGKLFQV